MKKILAISGSTKKDSTNEKILRFIAQGYAEQLEVDVYTEIAKLPHFAPDISEDSTPELVRSLRKKISEADGVIFCTPEYVFSLPGSLKNAIDWNVSTTLFSGKPVAIMVASASGEKAFESLYLIMTTLEATIAEGARLLVKGAKGKIDENGQVRDLAVRERIDKLVEALVSTIEERTAKASEMAN